jgi:hypothetical protein
MLTDITAKYVKALKREGNNFDYLKWFKTLREEEAQAKRLRAATRSGQPVPAEIDSPANKSDREGASANSAPSVTNKTAPEHRSGQDVKRETPKGRLKRRLVKVRYAWNEFQATRARDAVYKYLEAVFAIIEHYKRRRSANGLLQQASKLTGLAPDKNADPFTTVIRCTCDGTVDNKTISKWARALRYVAHRKKPRPRPCVRANTASTFNSL